MLLLIQWLAGTFSIGFLGDRQYSILACLGNIEFVLVLVSSNLLVWYWKDNRVHMEIYRLIHIQNIAYTDIHRHECIYI